VDHTHLEYTEPIRCSRAPNEAIPN